MQKAAVYFEGSTGLRAFKAAVSPEFSRASVPDEPKSFLKVSFALFKVQFVAIDSLKEDR
ncbi:hypothetical protein Ciccas_001156 [Cichlidogyrus casuarinus]|uniref:Uncharacterized protein n=1 Tax=Cichlidogyrus casuarinus TaxID=1844966 RepID=A0ABD2QKT3_9PLAT